MDSYFTYYKVLFMIEILIAEFLFTYRLKKRKHFILKYSIGILILLLISFLFPTIESNALTSSLTFFLLFSFTILFLFICYDENIIGIIFCSIAAYTMQHFSYELANLSLSLIVKGQSPLLGLYSSGNIDFSIFDSWTILYILIYVLCYFASYCLLYFGFGKRIKRGQSIKIKSLTLLCIIGIGLVINIILNAIIVHSSSEVINHTIDYVYNLMCCVLLLYSQFSLLSNRELQSELNMVHYLWHKEKEQYALSKENIDIINRKCHDMKHQIRKIGEGKYLPKEVIREIEDSISFYDSIVKTGNETLDIILTEKSLFCRDNGILLSYIIDGKILNFIKESDLYSLFGNAIDNAIEAVLKIKDCNRRIIGIKIRIIENLITINISNTYIGDIFLNDEGIPITTKENKDYHGFGMRSISYIVASYGGSLSFTTRDNVFNLNILFSNR